MSAQHGFFGNSAPQPSSSALNSKRKRTSWCMEDFAYEQNKQMRIRSPRLDRRHTYPDPPPELVPDSSATASDEDQCMDHEMDSSDADHDMEGMDESGGGGGFEYENGAVDARIREDVSDSRSQGMGYAFGASGSGGFGFGPGAMEDEDDEGSETSGKANYPYQPYPSLTPHTNPHHFSNLSGANPSSLRPKSPLSAQAFSTTLRAPRTPGLLQPATAGPLAPGASDIERARAQHGPQCRSIPKLVLSQYPDPGTGERSLWSQCGDCGAVERKM